MKRSEINAIMNDTVDNRFFESVGRFPEIEEDEPILFPLFSEYPSAG